MNAMSITLRLSAVAAALGILSLGTAALLGATNPARADVGPEVTGGVHPYVSFSGNALANSNTTIYTVPNNRILVVTGAMTSTFASLYQDSTLKVHGQSYAMFVASTSGFIGALASGNGHVVFEPGSNVVLQTPSGTTYYFIQGYLAHP